MAAVLAYIACVVALIVRHVRYVFLRRRGVTVSMRNRPATSIVVAVGVMIVLAGSLFSFSSVRGFTDVEVVKSERVGIYDVKVVRGDTAEAITNWLDENGFDYDANDSAVFEDYVDRNWCFVTAQIASDPNTAEGEIVAEGLAAPLILKFASEEPIYPLALTAATGADTEVLLYTLSDSKLTCGERLKLRRAERGDPHSTVRPIVRAVDPDKQALFDDLPKQPMMLCKFKGRLTPGQMKQDLVLRPAPDNEPYRETKIVW
jgi:hypothetical protein